nr:MAG TPA: hypothetical protein [Caudoviricetes sp.]
MKAARANQSKGDFFHYEKRCFQLNPLSFNQLFKKIEV